MPAVPEHSSRCPLFSWKESTFRLYTVHFSTLNHRDLPRPWNKWGKALERLPMVSFFAEWVPLGGLTVPIEALC